MAVVAPRVRRKSTRNSKKQVQGHVDLPESASNLGDRMLLRSHMATHFVVYRVYRGQYQYLTMLSQVNVISWSSSGPPYPFHNGRTAQEWCDDRRGDGIELRKG